MCLREIGFGALLLVVASTSAAATPTTVEQGSYVGPKRGACASDLPLYPLRERENWTEGWVDLRFTVTVDGKVQDVVTDTQMGRGKFGEHTVKWLESCQFEPAKRNGLPVEAHNRSQRFLYRITDSEPGARPEIVRRLNAVDVLLKNDQTEQALSDLDKIEDDSQLLYEMIHVTARRALAMAKAGKPDIALLYAKQLRDDDKSLAPRERMVVQRLKLQLALAGGLYLDAKDAAEHVDQFGRQVGDEDLMERLTGLGKAFADDAPPVAVAGRIPAECHPEICSVDNPAWTYRPVRRTISLAEVNGELDKIRALCDGRTFTAKAEADVTWTIPASWGACRVSVTGKPGSTFRLIDENT